MRLLKIIRRRQLKEGRTGKERKFDLGWWYVEMQHCFIVLWQEKRMVDVCVTFPKSRTSNRSKASNKSLFFIANTTLQDIRNVRMFFKHKNCKEQINWHSVSGVSMKQMCRLHFAEFLGSLNYPQFWNLLSQIIIKPTSSNADMFNQFIYNFEKVVFFDHWNLNK